MRWFRTSRAPRTVARIAKLGIADIHEVAEHVDLALVGADAQLHARNEHQAGLPGRLLCGWDALDGVVIGVEDLDAAHAVVEDCLTALAGVRVPSEAVV